MILKKVIEYDHRPFDSDCPKNIEQLIKDCTKTDPKKRFDINTMIEHATEIKYEVDEAKSARDFKKIRFVKKVNNKY